MAPQGTTPPTHGDDPGGAVPIPAPAPTPTPAPAAGPDRTFPDHPIPATAGPSASGAVPMASSQYAANEPMTDVDAAAGAAPCHHLLHQADEHGGGEPNVTGIGGGVPRAIAFRLYTSHFLSTWNSRVFEFGAALFLTSVFPGTLLPVSIYSLVRNAGYILLAHPLGRWISRGNRLSIIRTSIVGQRVPVAASCALLLVLERKRGDLGHREDNAIFAVVVFLAVVEKLCSTMNTISVERDWVSRKHVHSSLAVELALNT